MKKIGKMVHLPTVRSLLAIYVIIVIAIFCLPHRLDGFGRSHAYQLFAYFGKLLSFGLLDRTFTDWLYAPGTAEENFEHYDRFFIRYILELTPIYLAWIVVTGFVSNKLLKQ